MFMILALFFFCESFILFLWFRHSELLSQFIVSNPSRRVVLWFCMYYVFILRIKSGMQDVTE